MAEKVTKTKHKTSTEATVEIPQGSSSRTRGGGDKGQRAELFHETTNQDPKKAGFNPGNTNQTKQATVSATAKEAEILLAPAPPAISTAVVSDAKSATDAAVAKPPDSAIYDVKGVNTAVTAPAGDKI